MDNHELKNKFHRFKQDSPSLTVNEDFETRVFSKIKKKKKQRKITASVVLGILVFAVIFIGQATLLDKEPAVPVIARSESAVEEEIPVVEDVVFASSDSRTDYAIENVQVAYNEDDNSI